MGTCIECHQTFGEGTVRCHRCSGRLDVELTWGEGAAQPHAGVSLTLQPLQARLKPEHPALLAHLAACISASLAARATPEQDLASACMLGALGRDCDGIPSIFLSLMTIWGAVGA